MTQTSAILDLARLDGAALTPLLALNNAFALELSEMSAGELQRAASSALYARGCLDPAALLLAYDQAAAIDSVNFRWFQQRHARFIYIDRVVVAPAGRGRGLARRLYCDLIERARAAGHTMIGCEVNIAPPNLVSDAFHAAMGFLEVGRAHLADRGKTVRYLRLDLGTAPLGIGGCSGLDSS